MENVAFVGRAQVMEQKYHLTVTIFTNLITSRRATLVQAYFTGGAVA